MANASVSEWSTTAADNTELNGISLAENVMRPPAVNNAFREEMAQIASYTRRGADLASAATLNLDSVDSLLLDVTGTTTVTAVTLTSGHWRVVRAVSSFTLTASSSLIVNGSSSVSYTTTAGDLLMFEGYASSVVRVWLVSPSLLGKDIGQCRLVKSGSNLVLLPHNGNQIRIGSSLMTIPNDGVSLAPTGLTPSTLYYIYAHDSSGTLTLAASTTAPVRHDGRMVKTGDSTQTLVGMARPITGPAWQDAITQRFVRTWFNREPIRCLGTFLSGNDTTTSTSLVELDTALRFEALLWSGEFIDLYTAGLAWNSGAAETYTAVGIDGSFTTPTCAVHNTSGGPAISRGVIGALAEGYHYFTVMGAVAAGTGTWGGTSGARNGVHCGGVISGNESAS